MYKIKNLSATEISKCYLNGTLNPLVVTEYFLEKIYKSSKDKKKIFVNITAERALNEAYKSKKRYSSQNIKSNFDGIPCAWKDLVDFRGVPAFGGSSSLKDRKASEDAKVIKIADKAGIICLGKTSTVEFALGGIGTNKFNPTPNNILLIDKKRAPGGSSVGSAAAVFAGLTPISIGTDTGGSVRIPSAWHGLIGFKPSFGKIPTKGVLALSKSLDTIGPIAKDSDDILSMYKILSKEKINIINYQLKNITIAVCKNIVWDNIGDEDKYIYEEQFKKIKKKRKNIIYKEFPEITSIHNDNKKESLVVWEAWNEWKHIISEKKAIIDPNVLERMYIGKNMNSDQVDKIKKSIEVNRAKFKKSMLNIDALIMPTVPIDPPTIEELNSRKTYSYLNSLALRNTRISNFLDLPSITIPLQHHSNKTKGLLISCSSGNDYKTINIAKILEKIIN